MHFNCNNVVVKLGIINHFIGGSRFWGLDDSVVELDDDVDAD